MAQVPEYGRQVAPAGPAGTPSGPIYDIGLASWQQVTQQMAGQFAEQAKRLRRAEEGTEILGRTAKFSLGMQSLLAESKRAESPEAAEKMFREQSEKLRQDQLAWTGGSPESQAELDDSLTREFVRHQRAFLEEQEDRVVKGLVDNANLAVDTAVRTDNEALLRQSLNRLVSIGAITQPVADQRIADFPVDVKIERLRQKAFVDPDVVLTEAQVMQTEAGVSKEQRVRLREVEYIAKDLNYRLGIHHSEIMNEWLGKARTMDFASVRSQLAQDSTLTETKKTELLEIIIKASKDWQTTGISPYEKTQNQSSLVQAILDVESHKIKSLEEIDARCFEEGAMNWSIDDMLMVKRLFKSYNESSEGKFSFSHPIAEMAFKGLNTLYLDKNGKLKKSVPRDEYIDARMRLENALRENWGDSAKMDKAIEMALNPVKEKRAKALLSRWTKMSLYGGPINYWLLSRKKTRKEKSDMELPMPETREQYDALPSGTLYVDPDGQQRVKR